MSGVIVKNINREQWICDAAYYKSVASNFDPHYELSDWRTAEQDYLIMLQFNESKQNSAVTKMGLRQLAKPLPTTSSQK
ncbi:MAG: hypothetical protein EXR80_10840 [Methylococcales bacterium]|nr:hypothetical protein [Methylococcales bacterium]